MAHPNEKLDEDLKMGKSTISLDEVEDTIKTSKDLDHAVDDPAAAARKKALTRKVLWKIDLTVIPMIGTMYLCCFLDRANVGNAKILGMEDDLGLDSYKYGTALAVFYVFYILAEIPSTLLLKKVTPRIWLAGLGLACGLLGMCLAFVRNYAGFLVVRIILGLFEGGLLPGVVLYFSGMYTRGEIAVRIGVFYMFASLAGAFSGLLARGFSAIGPHGSVMDAGWRWIMLIEGLMTMFFSVLVCWLLPNTVATAWFLTPEEREHAAERLRQDYAHLGADLEAEKFSWGEVRRGIFNVQVWLTATAYTGICSGIYSFGIFLPSIIKGLGYTANAAQLWSVIPYAVAAVMTVVVAVVSDRLKLRGPIMLCTLTLGIIGYAVIANLPDDKVHAKYGMTMLMAIGLYASAPPNIVWNTNNSAGHYKKATTAGLQMSVANMGGFIGSYIYPNSQAPQYFQSHTIVMGLLIYSWCAVVANILWCMKINRDKGKGKYDKYTGYGDDRDPLFKMTI